MSDDKKEHPYIDELARDARGVCYNAFAKLIERADVIEEELLYSNAQLKDAITERDAALEREQALAAHVERLETALDCVVNELSSRAALRCERRAIQDARDALSENPTTSLVKRDLIKQAEALELVCFQSGPHKDTPPEDDFDAGWDAAFELLTQRAEDLRQQAEAQDD